MHQTNLSGDASGITPINRDDLWVKISEIDLEPIQIKLMFPREGCALTMEESEELAERYRKFLYLCGKHCGQKIIPTREIDRIWHIHILDTEKYANDCQNVFGYFLHHFPYLGLRGPQDERDRVTAFYQTEKLFEEVFGERYNCDAGNGSLCSSGLGGCEGDHVSSSIRPSFTSLGLMSRATN